MKKILLVLLASTAIVSCSVQRYGCNNPTGLIKKNGEYIHFRIKGKN